jgi:NADH:ubiquinone oxidoreductase subunit
MANLFVEFFAWWTGNTWGTRFNTWRNGEKVGTDALGNTYYRTRGGKIDPALGFERRWVIFNGDAEASKIPPGWHGWMHHRTDVAPPSESYAAREWEQPHVPNLTGTAAAYRPAGSILASGKRPAATGDYKAWVPGE